MWTTKSLMKSMSLQVLVLSMRATKSLVEVMFLRIEWMLVEWGTDEHNTTVTSSPPAAASVSPVTCSSTSTTFVSFFKLPHSLVLLV